MQLSKIILGLVAAAGSASAIDAYCHFGGNCDGGAGVCTNLNPDSCCPCSSGEIFPSVAFRGIPTFWNINGRGHNGGNCNGQRQTASNGGSNFICLRAGPFSGAGYGFIGKKRDTSTYALVGGRDAPSPSCTSYAKMDGLELADGAKYNLTALHGDEAKYAQILSIAQETGAQSAADFEAFAAFKIE